jgi:hypothetical protein
LGQGKRLIQIEVSVLSIILATRAFAANAGEMF